MAGNVVSREEWLEARKALLLKEKALTRQRDELAAERRALPRVAISKPYRFTGADGDCGLADLFGSCSQLIVYHFMYGPDWEEGCPSCSFWADNYNGTLAHLAHRDAALAVVSRTPYNTLAAYRERMGWSFPWYSSLHSDFNYDFQVSYTPEQVEAGEAEHNYAPGRVMEELPGVSVFLKEADGGVYHTYSAYRRGLDTLNGTYQHLDLLPRGRDEDELPWPMAWLRRHDQYED